MLGWSEHIGLIAHQLMSSWYRGEGVLGQAGLEVELYLSPRTGGNLARAIAADSVHLEIRPAETCSLCLNTIIVAWEWE